MQLNKALQITVKDAVTDLTKMLRFFPNLLSIMDDCILKANKSLTQDFKNSPADSKKNVAEMIKIARGAFEAQKKDNFNQIVRSNEYELDGNPENHMAWRNLGNHGSGGTIAGKKYSAKQCLEMYEKLKAKL